MEKGIGMSKFIIYGAGKRGKWCLDFLKWRGLEDCVEAFCDKRFKEIGYIEEKEVLSYDEAKEMGLPFLIAIINEDAANEVLDMMLNNGIQGFLFKDFYRALDEEQTVFLRQWCAYHHAKDNDVWFDISENKEFVEVFWNKDSVFYKYFEQLDLHNVIELACGRGRHVPYYIDFADKVTLVDILEENMIFCRERFKDIAKIDYYKNNGFNLEKLASNHYTSLFTYDSMVHFEMMDVYEYLKDIYRVLVNGGRALFHHSNYTANYKADFAHAPHARCFMNKDIFAYLACRAGFEILEQTVIDWENEKALDCITLLEKRK